MSALEEERPRGKRDARAIVAEVLGRHADVTPYVEQLLADGRREAVQAIVFYGSKLSEVTRGPGSFNDFYVVVDSYAAFFPRWRDRAVARVLPPNVYYRNWAAADGERHRCKYCVISGADLRRETSLRARDTHHLGRFSKRLALPYARDAAAREAVIDVALGATQTLLPMALGLCGRRSAAGPDDALIKAVLSISYLGEQRVSEGSKVEALFAAEADYYRCLFAALGDAAVTPAPPEVLSRLLARSRRRSVARWPKYMITFGQTWLDYVLDKVERNYGVRIELTPLERRFPLIFGWPKFFALRRKGVVK